MKVLVFDDNAVNRAAAQAQLKDHDLTVVNTYDEAQELLSRHVDWKKAQAILESQRDDLSTYYRSNGKTKFDEYFAAKKKMAEEQATPYFDIVLSDLLVPASKQAQGQMGRGGEEMPVGIFIGLLAAVKARAKYVAVFTDSNHHEHPASACFDAFGGESKPKSFKVEDSTVLLCNNRSWVSLFSAEDMSKEVAVETSMNTSYAEAERKLLSDGKAVRAKNWAALLEYLIKQ